MDTGRESKSKRSSGLLTSLSEMNTAKEKRSWLAPLVFLAHNPLSFVGLFLVNAAAVIWLFILPVVTGEGERHPYLVVFFLGVVPVAFGLGMILIPLGIYLRGRKQKKRAVQPREFRPLGWDNREFRNLAVFIVAATGLNVLVGGYFSRATIHYMASPNFCGTTCHSMTPEFIAYQDSPHRNVDCVECHIGSGRQAYVQAKLNGLSEVVSTVFNNFPRPIPTPVHNLRPAREICESCHWPGKSTGIKLRVVDNFAPDSLNTRSKTVLAMVVGGGPGSTGIHSFHVGSGVEIEYEADSTRQTIDWVRYTDTSGEVIEFATKAWRESDGAQRERRVMDCLDCHTRPSHRFKMPQRALNEALALGTVDTTLPWIKKQGLEILRVEYASTEEAAERIPAALVDFYQTQHPDIFASMEETVTRSASGLLEIYSRNVFPEMRVEWGTYPDNIGHSDFLGCFRCHGGMQTSLDGQSIASDCTACHQILALSEPEGVFLERLGITR